MKYILGNKNVSLTLGILMVIPFITYVLSGGGHRNDCGSVSFLSGDWWWQVFSVELIFMFVIGLIFVLRGISKVRL